jgi:uncharacterized protein YfiM (DUF2279 family)
MTPTSLAALLVTAILLSTSPARAESSAPPDPTRAQLRAALLFASSMAVPTSRTGAHETGSPVDSSFAGATPQAAVRDETGDTQPSLENRGDDPWFAVDKAQHLAFSFLWTLGTQYAIVNKVGLSERRALPISISVSALVGLAKEMYDLRMGPPHVFSFRDLAANAVGILLATGFILL